jgi:hypothetical protein
MTIFTLNGKPALSADDWKYGLADPALHWKPGYSAWALAHSWHTANGFPPEIRAVLAPAFPQIEMTEGLIEHKVPMSGKGYPSQNDLFVIATSNVGTICIGVEGKVSESLGPSISAWRDGSPNKEVRLSGLLTWIGLPREIPQGIRYQLLHRMASPVIEAVRLNASHAVMLIHSFSGANASFNDFADFVTLYIPDQVQAEKLYRLGKVGDVSLYAGWVHGDRRFLGL